LKTPKLQIVKQKTLKIHKSKASHPFTKKRKKIRTPKMTRRKLKTLKLKENKKSPKIHKMNCFFLKQRSQQKLMVRTITRKTKEKAKMKFKYPIPP
jgi:hypothetical protein